MKKVIMGALLFTPAFALAQNLSNVSRLVESIRNVIDILIPLVAAIALLAFFWGLVKVILNAGNEEEKGKGKHIMIWGVVALFIIVSVWGLVKFIGEAIGVRPDDTNQNIPGIGR